MSQENKLNVSQESEVTEPDKGSEHSSASDNSLKNRRSFNKTLGAVLGAAGIGLVASKANAETVTPKSKIMQRIQEQIEQEKSEGGKKVAQLYDRSVIEHGRYGKGPGPLPPKEPPMPNG